jgi:hypothetical protein
MDSRLTAFRLRWFSPLPLSGNGETPLFGGAAGLAMKITKLTPRAGPRSRRLPDSDRLCQKTPDKLLAKKYLAIYGSQDDIMSRMGRIRNGQVIS